MNSLDISSFEKRIQSRQLENQDYDKVAKLQQECFPMLQPWDREQYEGMIEAFPEGQIGITLDDELIASSNAIILNFDEYRTKHNFRQVSEIGKHNPEGDSLYGLEIMVDPQYRGMKLARRLYETRKQLAKSFNLKRFVIGGRIPGYHEHADEMTAREYVEKVQNTLIYDPVLTTQLSNGFVLKRLLPNYLPGDTESCGNATFLEWTNLDYNPDPEKQLLANPYVRVCSMQYLMRLVKDFDEFAHTCEYFIDVASDYHSDFIVFPEMFTSQLLSFMPNARPSEAARNLSEYTHPYLEFFTKMAIKYNINIIGGTHLTMEGDNLYNISFLFRRDGTIGKQYKIHITPAERKWWGVKPGNKVEVFDTDKGKIAILICYDIEFPELCRYAVEKGADIIFVPSNTDDRRAYLRVRYCAHARCIENQIYVVISGCVGNLPSVENLDIQYGQAAILTPSDIPFQRDGIAAEGSPNIEQLIFQDLDLNLLRQNKVSGSVLNWKDRRKDLYQLTFVEEEDKKKL